MHKQYAVVQLVFVVANILRDLHIIQRICPLRAAHKLPDQNKKKKRNAAAAAGAKKNHLTIAA